MAEGNCAGNLYMGTGVDVLREPYPACGVIATGGCPTGMNCSRLLITADIIRQLIPHFFRHGLASFTGRLLPSVRYCGAWSVDFCYGRVCYGCYKTYGYYVRAVRGGQCGSFGDLDISKSGNGTVTSTDGKITAVMTALRGMTSVHR